jgi:Glycosyltransferase family 9 (heptosyltransferase)
MPVIHKPDNKPLNAGAGMVVPAKLVPSFRVVHAEERGVRNNILIRAHGGLGDIVCSEPAIRFALNTFKEAKISLATMYPGLFQHLKFEKVYGPHNVNELKLENYLMFDTVDTANELAAEFVCHTLMHGVDYASMFMWRMILPNEYKKIQLVPTDEEKMYASELINPASDVIIHAGKTWKSRSFPKNWWDTVTKTIHKAGARPVLIGGNVDVDQNGNARASTIDVDTTYCLDLRHNQTIMQTVATLQLARVVLTNDSSPLHIAATGDSWIGTVSTVKHFDHLKHHRMGGYGWRMEDFARDCVFNSLDACPNKDKTIRVDEMDTIDLLKWIPDPVEFARWALSKLVV